MRPAQQRPCVTMCNETRCCAAGSTTCRKACASGAHDTQGVDVSTRNSIAPLSRTVRNMSDSRSNPDAGQSDSEDRSWPLVIVEPILIRAEPSKGTGKMQTEPKLGE
jgi:hypothetical protein